MRVPVTGGIKERNELEAAKLGQRRALLGLKEVETQIANALDSATYKTRSYVDNIESYKSVVDFHEQLVTSQMDRLKVGRIDTLTVLQNEEKLFEARIAELENLIQYQKAFLEMELVTGSTLQVRHLEVTKAQLRDRTADYLRGRLSEAALEKYSREAAKQYYEDLSPNSLTTRRALDTLHKEIKDQDIETERKALELLRDRIEKTNAEQPSELESHRKALELLRQQTQPGGQSPSPDVNPQP
jgi:hypothetical protein